MKVHLTTQERLKDLRKSKNLTLDELADLTGISSSSLQLYESNETQDIGGESLKALAKFYGVTTDYLLALTETAQPNNASFSELHLTDRTLEILKTDRFNHQLFCEIIEHTGFENFLADLEIYVDGIAASQIHTLNAIVEFAKKKIIAEHHPDENDFTLRELKACHVDEFEFFRNTLQSDLEKILRDLRKAHAGEKETAPEQTLVEELTAEFAQYEKVKGVKLEQQFAHLCKLAGVKRSKVPEIEKMFVMLFVMRSKNFRALK